MDWHNVDLDRQIERDKNIIEPYSFETLLLECSCNIRDLTKEAIREQFETELRAKIKTAREIFNANIDNIHKKAIEERNQ